MDPQRFRRMAELFEGAWRRPLAERPAYVDRACAGDEELRSSVYSLLLHFENSSDPLNSNWLDRAAAESPGLRTELTPLMAGAVGGSSMVETAPHVRDAAAPHAIDGTPPTRIDRYELLEQLGEGGFGEVHRARQTAPVVREVALKLIKPGMDSRQVIARFEAERQALALMDHPCIARVFDAGTTTAGRPYFVMELVRGVPITQYANERQLGVRARLALFVQVCEAVQHAHQKGVIHRDLKPSNILVVEKGSGIGAKGSEAEQRASYLNPEPRTLHPHPKVIDFGIAKATQQPLTDRTLETLAGQFVGTPAYMSPEQADLHVVDVDTRSDIYSLGALLYELLCGVPPFDPEALARGGLAGLLRAIREEEPPPPSARSAALRGELDWIVLKCLEKDRAQRYQSASALADDVERYLRDEPVLAGPQSRLYRLRKLVKRNRGVFAAVVTIVVLLVTAVAGTTYGLVVARTQRDLAEKARGDEAKQRGIAEDRRRTAELQQEHAEAVTRFLTMDLLGGMDALRAAGERDERLSDVLARAEKRIDGGALADQPLAEAAVHEILAELLLINGRFVDGERHARAALRIYEAQTPLPVRVLISLLTNLGLALDRQGRLPEAGDVFREALALADQDMSAAEPMLVNLYQDYGDLLHDQGENDAAEAYYYRALRAPITDRPELAGIRGIIFTSLGELYRERGDLDGAIEMADYALLTLRAAYGDEHQCIATALSNKGFAYKSKGDSAAAAPLYRAALEMRRKLLPPTHVDVAQSLNNLAGLLLFRKEFVEAEQLYCEALEVARQALPPGHYRIALVQKTHGTCLMWLKRWSEAESELEAAYAQLSAASGLPPQYVQQTVEALVKFYDTWATAEPESGAAAKAAAWRARLPTTQPASAPG